MKVNYTLCIFGLIFVIGLTVAVNYYKAPWEVELPADLVERRVKEVLMDTSSRSWAKGRQNKFVITTSETAIKVAEPILFEVYGEEKVLGERPYKVHKAGDYWLIRGSLPKLYDGGTFEIILDASDARVMSIVHYR
jgi:hypothetical protein